MRGWWAGLALVVAGCATVTSPTDPGRPPREEPSIERSSYGSHPDQHVLVHRPGEPAPDAPTVVLMHGGFWLQRYQAELMTPLAEDLVARGHVVVNVEYRRVGGAGGWPETFADVAAAIDHLADLPEVATDRVVTVGHSAGGHLAVWAAARHRLPDGATGSAPRVRPCAAISQAGMIDLGASARASLGNGAVARLMGGSPDDVPDRYAIGDPAALLPLGIPVALVHGEHDDIVPIGISRGYAERARELGDDVELVALPGGHFDAIDPDQALWQAVTDRIATICP